MYVLPSEIYERIFQYLDQRNLQTCYLVCKHWYSIAILLNWESVTLRSSKIILVKSQLNNPNYREYFKHTHCIKKLTIGGDSGYSLENNPPEDQWKFSKQELLLLLNHLPSLSEIDLSDSKYVNFYLGVLLDVDEMNISKVDVGYQNPVFRARYSYDLYFLVCHKFRHSISSMILHYRQRTLKFNSQEIDIFNSLNQFEQLTQLEFYNKLDHNLTPYHVQDVCPKLKTLKFVSDFPISENSMLCRLSNHVNINLNYMAGLTHLDLKLPSILPNYTRYIGDCFTNQLVITNIEVLRQGFFHWVGTVGMELALKFMEKIGKIKEIFVKFGKINQYEVHENDENDMTKYFKLLNAFRGTRQTKCSANFSDPSAGYSIWFFKYDSDGKLLINYGTYPDDFNDDSINSPDKTSSIIGPEIFDDLKFSVRFSDIGRQTLNYSFLNCPKLQSFKLLSDELQYEYRCSYIEYKHVEDLTSSDQANRYINYLRMGLISPVQTYFDLVTTYLHNIETVSLVTLGWSCMHNDSAIDLTCFKKLKTFIYKTEISDYEGHTDSDDDFIRINFTNGEQQFYYLDKEKNKSPEIEHAKNPTTPCLTLLCDVSVSFDFSKEWVSL